MNPNFFRPAGLHSGISHVALVGMRPHTLTLEGSKTDNNSSSAGVSTTKPPQQTCKVCPNNDHEQVMTDSSYSKHQAEPDAWARPGEPGPLDRMFKGSLPVYFLPINSFTCARLARLARPETALVPETGESHAGKEMKAGMLKEKGFGKKTKVTQSSFHSPPTEQILSGKVVALTYHTRTTAPTTCANTMRDCLCEVHVSMKAPTPYAL